MGIDTVAKLRGNVSTKEICDFISNHLKCKVEDDTRVAQYPTNSHIATYYTDNREKYEIVSGFIRILLPETRSLFYMKINVNFYENLEYYKEKGLEEMVTSETTHVSLGAHGNATEIICALAEHFGGWYCTNDCEDDYVEVKQKKHQDRIDIMVDIETLGKGSNPPVFQIAASAFNIKTGEIIDRFNAIADIDISDIEKDTLLWWLNTNPTLLAELLKQGAENKQKEEDIVKQFCEWTSKLGNKNVFMWGNGILFDNRIIQQKCWQYNLQYPIFYRNDRDVRTILELAAKKCGCSDAEYKEKIPMTGTAHNALDDVYYQVALVSQCYKDIFDVL